MQLADRSEQMTTIQEEKRALDEKVAKIQGDFEEEQKTAFEITRDMTRQYKGMQEELIAQINKHEQTIAEQKDQLERSQLALEEVRRQMAVELALKDSEIAEQKQKMEDMAVEFGEMLKETLDKMSEKIEITNQGWEAGTGDSIARRLEEHKMGVSADPH